MKKIISKKGSKTTRVLIYNVRGFSARRGTFLVEGTIALFLLVGISFVLIESSLNILKPRSYVMNQNMADAYMSYEKAYANRIDFDEISTGVDWPLYPSFAQSTVTIGTMPGNAGTVNAVVKRTRIPVNRIPVGTDPVLDIVDLDIQIWKLESHLVYNVGGQDYVKSRTIIRSQ